MTEQAPVTVDARPRLDPPGGARSALGALLGIAGALIWPIALWGQYDPREYLGVFLGSALVIVLGTVLVVAYGTRTLGTAMLAGGLPVASAQVWWLFTDSLSGDWPVVAASVLLTAGGLIAAWARRDPALVSGYRRWAIGLASLGLLLYVAGLALEPGWFAALVAAIVMAIPLVISFGWLVGRRLGTAMATAALLLAVSVMQETHADSFVDGPLLLLVGGVILVGLGGIVAVVNPVVSYRQRTPASPAVAAAFAALVLCGLSVGLAASAEAKTEGVVTEPTTPPTPTPSPTPKPTPTATGSPAPSARPTPKPTPTSTKPPARGAVPSYEGQAARSAAEAGLDTRCKTDAARTICVDKAESKLYFLGGDQVVLTLDARFGGAANPTREGSFTIYRKDANHTSTLFGSNMPYAMFFSNGEAVHYSSDFAARGYNGHSHGCVNIRDKAALAWLFDQVPVGTPVYIYS